MASESKTRAELLAENEELRRRLEEAEAGLRARHGDRERTFLECLIDNAGSCICVVKGRELRYTLVNRAYQAIKPELPMVGRTFAEVFPESAEAGIDEQVRRVLETGEPWRMDAFRTAIAGREDATWRGHVVRLPGRPGEEPSALTVVWDITDLIRTEQALKELNEELEIRVALRTVELADHIEMLKSETAERIRVMEELRQNEQLLIHQSRLAALGEMIGNIAHQWRQPLNALGLLIQQTPVLYELGEVDQTYLDRTAAKSMALIQHMSRTIDDFRNFFRPDKEQVSFSILDELAKTLSLIDAGFQACHIRIDIVAECEPVIDGYPSEFSQVLLNILLNARDALSERGTPGPRVLIRVASDEERAVVEISDNAGGVPDGIIGKIFDPYFTTKGPQAGTGVGLFMSKTIIEKNMGGRLTVSNTAEGACFRIEV